MGKRQRKVEKKEESKPEEKLQCRICLSEEEQKDIISPCDCKGTVKYVHKECLQKWVDVKGSLKCDLCKRKYKVKLNTKNFVYYFAKDVLMCITQIALLTTPFILMALIDYHNNSQITKINVIVFGAKGVGKTTLIENMKTFIEYDKESFEINYIEKGDDIKISDKVFLTTSGEFFIHLKRFKSCKNTVKDQNILIWNSEELSVSYFNDDYYSYRNPSVAMLNIKKTENDFYKWLFLHMKKHKKLYLVK